MQPAGRRWQIITFKDLESRDGSSHSVRGLGHAARISFFAGKCRQPCTGNGPVQGLKKQHARRGSLRSTLQRVEPAEIVVLCMHDHIIPLWDSHCPGVS